MAVQAQYPSNVLLLNRNVQESRDFSLQPQQGRYLEQSHMLFNNGGTINPRKRGREVASTNIASGNNNNNNNTNNQYNLQNQSTQLIDLSQLHNHQSNVVSTGLQLSFDQQQRQEGNLYLHSSSLLSEDISREIKQQRDEIDQFLQAQGDQLRRTLAEKRQRHYRVLLGTAKETVARKLREKEAEVEKATRRNAELEARAAQLSIEAQVWQAKARAQEAAAAQLQAQLQQAIISGHGRVDDCGGGSGSGSGAMGQEGQQAEDAESAYNDPDRVVELGPSCKTCRKRVASVLLLPCRHLSLCRECDRVVEACPICFCMRISSVEVYFS